MIVALHGNLGSPFDWDAVVNAFPADWHCVHLWRDRPVTAFGSWVDQLNDFAEALDPRPILIGYSLGGRLAMHALLDAPDLWKAAVFVSAHPGLENGREERLQADLNWAARLDHPSEFLAAWNAQPALAGDPVSPRQEAIVREFPAPIARAFDVWSLGRQENLRERLAACPVPQLWVCGENDAKFRALAPGRLAVIPKCGHRVLLQSPRELADCIRHFLTELNLIQP